MKKIAVVIFLVLSLSSCGRGREVPLEGETIKVYIRQDLLSESQVYNFDRDFIPGVTKDNFSSHVNCLIRRSRLPRVYKWEVSSDTSRSVYVSFAVDEKGNVLRFSGGDFFINGIRYDSGTKDFEEKLARICDG